MEENTIQQLASKFVNHTNKNIFLTGKAGTGKTTFLRSVIANTHKKTLVVAPTGIAAINAGGTTIHSLFQLPFGSFVPSEKANQLINNQQKINTPISLIKNLQMSDVKRNLLREVELLIIDEVSMLRADLLDAIDLVLRHVRRKNFESFGGVQVLFIGDLQQLPPVINDSEWSVLKEFYKSVFFFDAKVLEKEKPIYVELEKIYRQSDSQFIDLLNNLRNNSVTQNDEILLNQYYQPSFKPNKNEGYITLTTHNYKAINLNKEKLNELKSKSYFFEATVTGDFNEHSYPLEKTLELKLGAQIMFVKNDNTGAQRFFNGKIGTVSSLDEKNIEVEFENKTKKIKVETYEWQNIKYKLNTTTNEIEEEIAGSFVQFPIKLAWAITVHKSQGLTFEKAIIDVENAFAPGQIYVALSRLTSLKGLVLNSKINFSSLQQQQDVYQYEETKNKQENLSDVVSRETVNYTKNYLINSFDFDYLNYKLKSHAESYSKDEKKSIKQKYADWAKIIFDDFSELKTNADKFRSQINTIFTENKTNLFEHTHSRIESANNYFTPVLKKITAKILSQIENIKNEKKIKTYANELLDLELCLYEQVKKIHKSKLLINTIIENKEFTRSIAKEAIQDTNRLNEIEIKTDKKVKNNEEKKKKIDTKLETLNLYKQQKTIEEIAKIRSFTVSTIEGHLAYFIAKGEVSINNLIEPKKLDKILAAYKKTQSFNSSDIKKEVDNDISYGEIKMVLASVVSPS